MSAPVSVYVSAEVSAVADLYGELVGPGSWVRPGREQIRLQAARLALGHRLRAPGALVELSNWHPDLAGSNDVAVWSAVLSENDFLGTVAREHGYRALEDVNSLADGRPDPDFERAVEAVLAGDTDDMDRLLATRPDLVGQRSHWPHRATLLHYTAANGVETHRQRVPLNVATVITTLAARGADVNAVAGMYGGGQTPLHLLVTSAHPAAAGVAAMPGSPSSPRAPGSRSPHESCVSAAEHGTADALDSRYRATPSSSTTRGGRRPRAAQRLGEVGKLKMVTGKRPQGEWPPRHDARVAGLGDLSKCHRPLRRGELKDGVAAGNDLFSLHAVARRRRAVAAPPVPRHVAEPMPSPRMVASNPWKNQVPLKTERSSGPAEVAGRLEGTLGPGVDGVVVVARADAVTGADSMLTCLVPPDSGTKSEDKRH